MAAYLDCPPAQSVLVPQLVQLSTCESEMDNVGKGKSTRDIEQNIVR